MTFPEEEEALWKDFDTLESELGGDVRFFQQAKDARAGQRWRRAYARAASAYLEGISSWMARQTLFHHSAFLGDDERQVLLARNSALERAFHAVDLFTNLAGTESPLERCSREWESLSALITLRNRLAHPKNSSDIIVSDQDLLAVDRAASVVQELALESFRRSGNALMELAKAYARMVRSDSVERAPDGGA